MDSIAGSFYILLYYLPIYFQAVKGVDAIQSGIRTLPLILGMSKETRFQLPSFPFVYTIDIVLAES